MIYRNILNAAKHRGQDGGGYVRDSDIEKGFKNVARLPPVILTDIGRHFFCLQHSVVDPGMAAVSHRELCAHIHRTDCADVIRNKYARAFLKRHFPLGRHPV